MSGNEFEIRRYTSADAEMWNRFVERSKNGTFLFDRRYMDYHKSRFHDRSYLFFRHGKLVALLPANDQGEGILVSHAGLTYGGLVTDTSFTAEQSIDLFTQFCGFLRKEGVQKVIYKAIPWIYHRMPAEEDLYALTQVCHARLVIREISSTISFLRRKPFNESRKSGIRKAERSNIVCRECNQWEVFWHILDNNLKKRYHVHPVHTLEELCMLHKRFPDRIRLFMAYRDNKPLGGTVIYDLGQVIHTQYISATQEGKSVGALDALFDYIINKVYAERSLHELQESKSVGDIPIYFDFGKSTEKQGNFLNRSLIFQKEGFGARGVCYDTYEWTLN
ncbi:MAG: GNAT family N-acetyltransferase [Prevotella sp.]|jgi:hypothetical protein